MSVGLGIFLGLVFCGLVYLYTKSPDKVNVRKILKYLGMATGSLVVLMITVSFLVHLYEKRDQPIEVAKELNGIQIGKSYADFMFTTKGANPFSKNWDRPKDAAAMENDGIYQLSDGKTDVTINNDKVSQVSYTCDEPHDSMTVDGIGCGSFGENITAKYGNHVSIVCPEIKGTYDPKIRVYRVDDFGLLFFLYENQVKAIYVYSKDKPFRKNNGDKNCG